MNYKANVSIIIPVFNSEKYLESCIKSVLNQTYNKIEIILVNDGSSDSSGGICDSFAAKDKRIRVIHQTNSGPSHARNMGIKAATGQYIQFVDSDDSIDRNMTSKLVEQMKNNVQCVICGFRKNAINEIVNKTNLSVPAITGTYNKNVFIESFGELYFNLFINSPVNKMYKTEIIKKFNILFPESMKMGEDLLFNIDYIRYCTGDVTLIAESLYNYNDYNDDSLTKKYSSDYFENQTFLYTTVKKFLVDYGQYKNENKEFVERKFSKSIFSSFSKLFHMKDGFSAANIKKQINLIVTNERVYENAKFMKNGSIQLKVVGYLIRRKSVSLIFCFFYIKSILRKSIDFITSK